MIRLIEALNFRCLRYVRQPLGPFHVLVGPNATGKTTFLDVVAFLGRLVCDGLEAAVTERTQDFRDIVWGRDSHCVELAIEAVIPQERRSQLPPPQGFDTIRYEVCVGQDAPEGEIGILAEKVLLRTWREPPCAQRELFPMSITPPPTIMFRSRRKGIRPVVSKARGGNDNFYSEVLEKSGKGWFPSIRLGPRKSALGNLPEDESRFPVSTWLKGFLTEGVQQLVLNSLLIRRASAPSQVRRFRPDGSNLPWMVAELASRSPERFRSWIAHLQTALPDLENIETVERPDDKHRYLVLCYAGGLRVPSWMASDGTLRLLALTLLAYLPAFAGVYLVEEPENGIHPRAVETLFQSVSSVYGAQVLMATHSPIILGVADPSHILCFQKTTDGATDVVLGSDHPALQQWRGETSLGDLFAAGVLG